MYYVEPYEIADIQLFLKNKLFILKLFKIYGKDVRLLRENSCMPSSQFPLLLTYHHGISTSTERLLLKVHT